MLVHTAHIEKGKLVFEDRERFLIHIATLEGKRIDVTLRKHRENRTDQQNRYYFGVIVEILAEYCGYTTEEMHEALKIKFLGERDFNNNLIRVRSTAKLETDEFIQYTNKIVIWAASELQVYIPDPGSAEV